MLKKSLNIKHKKHLHRARHKKTSSPKGENVNKKKHKLIKVRNDC